MDQEQVKADTERARKQAFAELRRHRMEKQMTSRIRKAWAQLDVATDEIVRLNGLIQKMSQPDVSENPDTVASFMRDLALEKAKAMGKAEILAILMPVPLDTPAAISQEAGRRWQARQQGVSYETPGIRMVAKTVMDDIEGDPEFT